MVHNMRVIEMEEEILSINKINKNFEGLQALKEISLKIKKGEILGIIGPNGAGKTTLFNVISGQLNPDSGSIFFEGIDITKLKPHEISRLGIVRTFQIVRPFRDLSVYENILASYLNSDREKNENLTKNILKLIENIGLVEQTFVEAGLLTIGLLKKLEIGRALSLNPKILLLDEPFAGSSMEEISDMIKIIRNVNEQGMTVVIIEHVIRALIRVIKRGIVLDRGEIIAEGNPNDIVNNEKVINVYMGKRLEKYA